MLSSIKPFRQINILTSLRIPIVNYNQIQIMMFLIFYSMKRIPKKRKKKKYKQKEENKEEKKTWREANIL